MWRTFGSWWRGSALLLSLALPACVPVEAGDRVVVVPQDRVVVIPDREADRWWEEERGPFVRCRLRGGEIRFGDDWAPYVPAEFTLGRGDVERVRVIRRNGREARILWAERSRDGETIRICARDPRIFDRAGCAGFRAGRRALREGVSVRLDRRRLVRGALLSCESLRRPRPAPPPRPGAERLECRIAGTALFPPEGRAAIQPTTFAVRRGGRTRIVVWRLGDGRTRPFLIRWTGDGRRLVLCTPGPGAAEHCRGVDVPAARRFRARDIDIPPAAFDLELRCRRR